MSASPIVTGDRATQTATLAPTSAATPTPTPQSLGPEGAVVIKDNKVWLVCKDGTYAIDIPAGFSGVCVEGYKPAVCHAAVYFSPMAVLFEVGDSLGSGVGDWREISSCSQAVRTCSGLPAPW